MEQLGRLRDDLCDLITELKNELATLQGRVDDLEAREESRTSEEEWECARELEDER